MRLFRGIVIFGVIVCLMFWSLRFGMGGWFLIIGILIWKVVGERMLFVLSRVSFSVIVLLILFSFMVNLWLEFDFWLNLRL